METLSPAHLQVLSALLRLSRRREFGTIANVELRCNLSRAALVDCLHELSALDLVIRTQVHAAAERFSLTLPGFGLAVMFAGKRAPRAKRTVIRRAA